MNTQKGFAPILLILLGLMVVGGGVLFYTQNNKNEVIDSEVVGGNSFNPLEDKKEVTDDAVKKEIPVACTMDAKQCSDGSYVGRTGPKCEFVCPMDNKKPEIDQTKSWSLYSSLDQKYSIKYPGEIKPYESIIYGDPESVGFSFSIPTSLAPLSEKYSNAYVQIDKLGAESCKTQFDKVPTSSYSTNFGGVNFASLTENLEIISTGNLMYREIYLSPILSSGYCYHIMMDYAEPSQKDIAEAHTVFLEMMRSLKIDTKK